ncbi:hypothetical protein G8J22_01506 [Lentilactobacillus hilgardii]|uniref:cupredoxin domain-containing protein n=1 Tax=Lentilactobacillus hilgardii TaxID=1588 RepID=UPI00019C5D38|nr:cupredoxin domain-containing protein [Lentilactobacillus hilgardii]EEI18611.1 hypothetical protein HMPREF0497_2548 [Lentilactobacillus buchneri ATCC 11577]MCT3397362.1 cupredoxin domain-containing protein [Lentilactobacillus hilgardii]QIR09527.1 hypothetical protein G8J22_01506 [Lentilactobacillus hilgardii]
MVQMITFMVAILLIAFIVWWFFGKHEGSVADAQVADNKQETTVWVDGGYSPSTLFLKKGIPAKVSFRMNDSTVCLSHVVFEKLGIDKDLTKQSVTEIEIPTDKAQEFDYACGMNMFHGKIIVKN